VIYIATVWTMSDDGDGPEYFRRIERGWARSPEDFVDSIRREDANDELTIGPVSESRNQETRVGNHRQREGRIAQ
jgi:hypothetical protein